MLCFAQKREYFIVKGLNFKKSSLRGRTSLTTGQFVAMSLFLTDRKIRNTVIWPWKIFSVKVFLFCAIIYEIKSHEFFSTMDN